MHRPRAAALACDGFEKFCKRGLIRDLQRQ
jgi:hypothetical protein